jgi:siroheme synthase
MGKGKVKDLERIAKENLLTHPSIIIIGSVVDINNLAY